MTRHEIDCYKEARKKYLNGEITEEEWKNYCENLLAIIMADHWGK
jgi:hypothetical protein